MHKGAEFVLCNIAKPETISSRPDSRNSDNFRFAEEKIKKIM